MPIPPGGYVTSRSRPVLWGPGLGILAAWYLPTLIAASVLATSPDDGRRERSGALMVPVAGPWLFLPEATEPGRPWLVLNGISQGAGLVMIIVGIASRRRTLVYYGEGPRGRDLALAPKLAPGSAGFSLAF